MSHFLVDFSFLCQCLLTPGSALEGNHKDLLKTQFLFHQPVVVAQ